MLTIAAFKINRKHSFQNKKLFQMTKVLVILILIFAFFDGKSQDVLYHENFELPYGMDSASSQGTPSWIVNSTYYFDGFQSARNVPSSIADTLYLITNSFSTMGRYIVELQFSHICKLEFADNGIIEVSVDGGLSWFKLSSGEYKGNGQFGSISNRFTSVSYPIDWDAADNSSVPTNSWWKTETFDIGAIAGNKSNVKIRFALSNGSGGTMGPNGAYGWLIDDIKIVSPFQQEAALIDWEMPFALPSGCGLSNEVFQIKVKNLGSNIINGNLQANFQRKGGILTSETVPNIINVGDSLVYTFQNKIDLNPINGDTVYEIKAWISLTGDSVATNDTLDDLIISKIPLASPTAADTTILYGNSVILNAASQFFLSWFTNPLATNAIAVGSSFSTPNLYDSTVFYVQASAQTSLCPSRVIPVKVHLSGIPRNNAGLTEIIEPSPFISSGIAMPIKVKIKNFGTDTLIKTTINYSINGVIKPPYIWVGSLAKNSISNEIQIGSEIFASGISNLKIWTSLPNDSVDYVNFNDSLSRKLYRCLSGAYTVGNQSADFENLQIVKAVIDSVGVCGPVVFNILSGLYLGNIQFNSILGSSPTNTVTFQSASGNREDVIIQYQASSIADNFVIRLNGSDNFIFKNLTIKATGLNYGYAVEIMGVADSNIFEGNYIFSPSVSSTNCKAVYGNTNTNDNFNKFLNNKIVGGNTGLSLFGSGFTSWEKGTIIQGNEVLDFYSTGIAINYSDSFQVLNNIVHQGKTSTQTGIMVSNCNNWYNVLNNNIVLSPSYSGYGLRELNNNQFIYNPSPTDYGTVANNMISITSGSGVVYGLYTSNTSGTNYLNNSVNISGGHVSSCAMYHSNIATNIVGVKFKNNIFSNQNLGYALKAVWTNYILESDFNNLYTNGTSLASWASVDYSNLMALQNISGKELNSQSVIPNYSSFTDLHINNPNLNNLGYPVSVAFDIDGESRNATSPDIGADEFTPIATDIAIIAMTNPLNACHNTSTPISIKIKNLGYNTLHSVIVKWMVNGTLQTAYSASDTIFYGGSKTIDIGAYTFLLGVNYNLKCWLEFPNGTADLNHLNDTLEILNFKPSLSQGIYTIGPTGSDYPTFSTAIQVLKSNGICGPVVFNIQSGIYVEQVELTDIQGTSPINTITFQSVSGINSEVNLNYNSSSQSANFTLYFNGAQHIIFKNLTIAANNATYGDVVLLGNMACANSIQNCIIQSAGNQSTKSSCIRSVGLNNNDFNKFINNKIIGGNISINLNGLSSYFWEKGQIVQNNEISNFYLGAISASYQDSLQIINNNIHSGIGNFQFGIKLNNVNNQYQISNNKITLQSIISATGFEENDCNQFYNAYPLGYGLIANNLISIFGGLNDNNALITNNSAGTMFFHNSLNVAGGNTNSKTFIQSYNLATLSGIQVMNNILSNKVGGYAFYIDNRNAIMTSDFNDIYSTTSKYIFSQMDFPFLFNYQQASGFDLNSLDVDPIFINDTNLHITNYKLNSKGSYVGIYQDFDGELRPFYKPDIGADEIAAPANELGVAEIYSLGKLSSICSHNHAVGASIENFSAADKFNIPVVLQLRGANVFDDTIWVANLPAGQQTVLTFDQYNSLINGYQTVKIILPNDLDSTNNQQTLYQYVSDSVISYSDTTLAPLKYGTGSIGGLILAKHVITTLQTVSAVNVFITDINSIGKEVFGVLVSKNGAIIDSSARKIISFNDIGKMIQFPFKNAFNNLINNDTVLVGLAQSASIINYQPVGIQIENPQRTNSYYYTDLQGGALNEFYHIGRPVIEMIVHDPPTTDLSAIEIVNPISGCRLGNQFVQLKIKNTGLDTINGQLTGLNVGFRVNNSLPIIENITNILPPNQELIHTFGSSVNMNVLNADSVFSFIGFVNYNFDYINSNDTTQAFIVVSKVSKSAPLINDTAIAYASAVTLNASHLDSVAWYSDSLGTNLLLKGNFFTTPTLFDSTTYYVEAYKDTSLSFSVGPTDLNIGTYSGATSTTYFQIFDVLNPGGIVFDTVSLFPYLSVGRAYTIVLQNSSLQTIATYSGITQYGSGGIERVPLNFTIPYGTGYRIGFTVNAGFRRNSNGSAYPYTIPGIISITGNSFIGYPDYYFFFYDWKVTANGFSAGCPSYLKPVNVTMINHPFNDAGIAAITNPTNIAASNIQTDIKVQIKNYGSQILDSVMVHYALDGVLKNSNTVSGLQVSKGMLTNSISVGSEWLSPGAHVLKVWTSLPNGSLDMYKQNDTLTLDFIVAFSDTITVGAIGSDFTNVVSAVNALKSFGICERVVVSIKNGTYNGNFDLDSIAGLSPSNRLIFTAFSGNPADVIIQFNASSSADNYVISFNGADYITLKNLTIKSLNSSYGKCIEISMGSSYNIIYNNIISSIASTSSVNIIINSSATTADEYNLFRKNQLTNGYYTFNYMGSVNTPERGNCIDSNTISGFYAYGIFVKYQDSIKINSNEITGGTYSTVYGINAQYIQYYSTICNNRVHINPVLGGYGIYLYNGSFYSNSMGLIANNFASNGSGSSIFNGLYLSGVSYLNVLYNNFSVNFGSASSRSAYITSSVNINLKNNNFTNFSGGYAFYNNASPSVNLLDFNNYYTSGTKLAFWLSDVLTLNDFKLITQRDSNSISTNPLYFSQSDLHTNSLTINNKATFDPEVLYDIDGQLRSVYSPDIGADEFTPPAIDAGVITLVNPTGNPSPGAENFLVKIKNFGTDSLFSATINWSINQIVQTPFSWTGNLGTFDTSVVILLGSHIINIGPNQIKIWTSNTNGTTDQDFTNDTLSTIINTCSGPYSGVYNVGGLNANFPTISNAIQSLQICGINGPVILNINPGNYNEQVVIPYIQGASLTNNILLTSTTGIISDVVLFFAANQLHNYTLKLDGAKHIKIKGLTIKAMDNIYGRAIEIANASEYCILDSNHIETVYGSANTLAGIYSPSSNENHITILNNRILNGYYGIYMYGNSVVSLESYNSFENNEISGFYNSGIFAYYQSNAIFHNNFIENGFTTGAVFGIICGYSGGAIKLEANSVLLKGGSNANGIYVFHNTSDSSNPSLIFNNFVSIEGASINNFGISALFSNHQHFYFNTVNVNGGFGITGRAMFIDHGVGTVLKNNIFHIDNGPNGGYALFGTPSNAVELSDYNCFYSSGSVLFYLDINISDLANWKTLTGFDSNSISVNPGFLSNSNPHISSFQIDGKATPIASITMDLDAELRNNLNPDIGADEFVVNQQDIGVSAINFPNNISNPVGSNMAVEIKLRNYGSDTITAFNVSCFYNGNTFSETWAGSLLPGAISSYTFQNLISQALGEHNLFVWTVLSTDQNKFNDTAVKIFTGLPVFTPSWYDSFDSSSIFWLSDGNMNIWQRGIPQKPIINSAHSAPNVWITDTISPYPANATEYLYSPYFNLKYYSNALLKFWHRFDLEQNLDYGRIQYSIDSGQTWINLGYISDPLGSNWYNSSSAGLHSWSGSSNGWILSTYDLSQFYNSSSILQFRFVFSSNSTTSGDGWAIDDFEMFAPPLAVDAELKAIICPLSNANYSVVDSVSVLIKNSGTSALNSAIVSYQINNSNAIIETWTGNLSANDSVIYTFNTSYVVPTGSNSFNICAKVKVLGDFYIPNDSLCQIVNILPPAVNVGVARLVSPASDSLFTLKDYYVSVWIKNLGTTSQTLIPVEYSINGQNPIVQSWTGNLPYGDSVLFSFSQPFQPTIGICQICAKTTLSSDLIPSDDEICVVKNGLIDGLNNPLQPYLILKQNIPNPTSGKTRIDYFINNSNLVHFRFYDSYGNILIDESLSGIAGINTIYIDVNGLSSGIYYYIVEINGIAKARKLVVQN